MPETSLISNIKKDSDEFQDFLNYPPKEDYTKKCNFRKDDEHNLDSKCEKNDSDKFQKIHNIISYKGIDIRMT